MKLPLCALIFATALSTISARIGDQDTSFENVVERKLCAENNDGCFSYFNPCCDGSSCHVNGRCYPYPRRKNDPCIPALQQCGDGLTCDMNGMKCREIGTEEDDKCNFSRPCEGEGLSCDLLTNKCRLPGETGDVCHSTRPCEEGLVCQAVSQTCRAEGVEGESCSVVESCAGSLTCDLTTTTCRGKSSVGERCHLSRFCESSLFCDFDTQSCKRAAALGQSCNVYVPCVNGLACTDEKCVLPATSPVSTTIASLVVLDTILLILCCPVLKSRLMHVIFHIFCFARLNFFFMQPKCELGALGCDGDDTTNNGGGDDAGLDDGPPPCPLTKPDCHDVDTVAPTADQTAVLTPGPNDGDIQNSDPEQAADNINCQRNIVTGECVPETSSPTFPFPSSTPTPAPTVSASPTVSAVPTIEDKTKCKLTGCEDDTDKGADDYPKVPVRKIPTASYGEIAKLSGERGGTGGPMGMVGSRTGGNKMNPGETKKLVKGEKP